MVYRLVPGSATALHLNETYHKLLSVFSEYKNEADIKKFDRKIEKAAKLLAPIIMKAKPATVSAE